MSWLQSIACGACSTGKGPKAGRANFQHQQLTGKGNIDKMFNKGNVLEVGSAIRIMVLFMLGVLLTVPILI